MPQRIGPKPEPDRALQEAVTRALASAGFHTGGGAFSVEPAANGSTMLVRYTAPLPPEGERGILDECAQMLAGAGYLAATEKIPGGQHWQILVTGNPDA
jgi:hypothetical protein